MTDRLYLADSRLLRFAARVVGRRRIDGQPAVALDRTAFYPEGGGQPADRGTLGGLPVVDVREADGEVWHLLGSRAGSAATAEAPSASAGPAVPDDEAQELPDGATLEGVVDGARREAHVQQHHGQHLLSAAFAAVARARTLSFHLGAETCTIDLDVPLSRLGPPLLREVEARANTWVFQDLSVQARELTPEQLARLPLRKEAVKGSRVVLVGSAVPDDAGLVPDVGGQEGVPTGLVDASPCGGTHPRRTGEVGAIAVLRAVKWGEGARVEFLCGGRVVAALATANERLLRAGAALRCSAPEVPDAAARAADDLARLRKEVEALGLRLAAGEAERLLAMPDVASGAPAAVPDVEGGGRRAGRGPVVAELAVPAGPTPAFLRAVASALAARGRVAVLGACEDGRAHLCVARPEGSGPSAGEALRAAVALLGGKGGGSPGLAQGSGPGTAALAAALALAAERMAG